MKQAALSASDTPTSGASRNAVVDRERLVRIVG
jgi:hypothetical protein